MSEDKTPWFMEWYESVVEAACNYSLWIGLFNWGCCIAQMSGNDWRPDVMGLINYAVGSLLISMWLLKKWNL